MDIAVELDLLSRAVNEGKALAPYHAGRIDDAVRMFGWTLELDPAYWRATLGLSCCHAARGDLHAATRAMVRAWSAGAAGGYRIEAREAEAKLERGTRPALEYLPEMARPRATATAATRCVEVRLVVLLGRHEDAIDILETARDERSLGFMHVHAPALDPLAGHARFRTLMEETGLLFPRWRRSR